MFCTISAENMAGLTAGIFFRTTSKCVSLHRANRGSNTLAGLGIEAVVVPGRSAGLSPQRIGTETLVSAARVTAAPLRYANNVATNPQAAANISQSPATARLSVAWIK